LHCTVGQVQSDRMRAAKMLHHHFNAIAILKGAGTVIATTAEHVYINPTGNPALATGGTGDVLAGVCGAFLAQGIPAEITALAATWVHGHAADQLVANGVGPIGLSPSEIIPAIRKVINAFTP
jgi:NAD(P)H-hydrate repair Nnr-like enzyme with NAD(P)H-hydrate dehydratase domain